jgi:hypothetical protein
MARRNNRKGPGRQLHMAEISVAFLGSGLMIVRKMKIARLTLHVTRPI